jgi:hypothetical protein
MKKLFSDCVISIKDGSETLRYEKFHSYSTGDLREARQKFILLFIFFLKKMKQAFYQIKNFLIQELILNQKAKFFFVLGAARQSLKQESKKFHLILFDPFSVTPCPKFWSEDALRLVTQSTKNDGFFLPLSQKEKRSQFEIHVFSLRDPQLKLSSTDFLKQPKAKKHPSQKGHCL